MQYIQKYFVLGNQSPFSALATADIMQHLNLWDNNQAVYVQTLLNTAVAFVEKRLQLDLRETTWTLVCDRFPGYWFNPDAMFGFGGWGYGPFAGGDWWTYPSRYMMRLQQISLERGPLQSLNVITYYDTNNNLQTLDPSTYRYSQASYFPAVLEPVPVFPISYARPDAVSINFTNNMAVIPASILHAIKLYTGMLYASRESISYGANSIIGRTGESIDCLLAQYEVAVSG